MRARNIKPGFFKNDLLAECSPLARLLFAGLWCLADREGRLEDRPARIKAELLPYDACEVDALLGELAQRRFLVRYEVAGRRYLEIPKFARHQKPHHKEQASTVPPPSKTGRGTSPGGDADRPIPVGTGACTDPGTCQHQPGHVPVCPDCGLLIADCLSPLSPPASGGAENGKAAPANGKPKKTPRARKPRESSEDVIERERQAAAARAAGQSGGAS